MRRSFVIIFLLLVPTAWAATFNATNCDRTGTGSIGGYMTSAAAGDVVIGPSGGGTSTWTGGKVTRTGGITIDGAGCDITFASSGADIDITLDSHALEIKNFTFEGATGNNDGQVIIRGLTSSTAACKIHDNIFKNGDAELSMVGHGDCVIYKNSITSAVSGSQSLLIYGASAGDYTTRQDSQSPQSAGGKIVTIEGNTFTNTNSGTYGQVQAYYGGSFVFRYNELYNVGVEVHGSSPGTCAGENGARWMEIYMNNHHPTPGITVPIKLRGGSGVVFGNTSTNPDNLLLDEDCTTTTLGWPIQAQIGTGIEPTAGSGVTVSDPTKWSPLYAWNNSGFTTTVVNTYFIQSGASPNVCTHTGNAATNAGTKCDVISTATQPTTLTRCQSTADVTAGCPVSYTYSPGVCPHPATGLTGSCSGTTSGTAGYAAGGWTMIQWKNGPSCGLTSNTCTVTLTATGANHVIVVEEGSNVPDPVTSVTDNAPGGSSVYTQSAPPTGCNATDSSSGGQLLCAYTIFSRPGATSLTVTRSTTTSTSWWIKAGEFSSTATSILYDNAIATVQSTGTTNPTLGSYPLAGTNDLVVQLIKTGSATAIASPYTNFIVQGTLAAAFQLNNADGFAQPASWTQANNKALMSSIAFRGASYTTYGVGSGVGTTLIGGWPFNTITGAVDPPQVWVNNLEWVGQTSNVINMPVTFTAAERASQKAAYVRKFHRNPTKRWLLANDRSGGSWTCPTTPIGTPYGPYNANDLTGTAGLNKAISDAEVCRANTNTGTQINVPVGAQLYSSTITGMVLPQSCGGANPGTAGCVSDTSTKFIVITSTSPAPTGRTLCSHGIQDNLVLSTQPGLRNVGCNGTALSYGHTNPTVVPGSGTFTFANGTSVTNPGTVYDDKDTYLYQIQGGNSQVSTQSWDINNIGPHHYVVMNAEMRPIPGDASVQAPLKTGQSTETIESQLPTHMHFAYNYIHGDFADAPVSGGVAIGPMQGFNNMPNTILLGCIYCSLMYNYTDQSARQGAEGHGISILLGKQIKNNHNWIEGEGIGFLCGGFASSITLQNFTVCHDMEDRGNRYTYPYSWVLAADRGYNPNSFYATTTNVTGTGSGAVVHLISTNGPPNNQSAMSYEITSPGTGYAVGNSFVFTNIYDPTASGAIIEVTAVGAGGAITSSAIASGNGYSVGGPFNTTCASPYCGSPTTGTGATVNITSVSPTGQVTGVTIAAHGSGYKASDNLKINGGDGNAMVGVATISSGSITGIQVVSGTTYHINSPVQKNRHEYKFSNRAILDGNIFEGGDFTGGQGQAVSAKANQSSSFTPGTNYWTTQQNTTITNNIMRENCSGISFGFRSNPTPNAGGGLSDRVARYYYFNNLLYNINIGNPGCQASIAFGFRLASDAGGTKWTTAQVSRIANIETINLNGTDAAGTGQGRFTPGDPVVIFGCTGSDPNSASLNAPAASPASVLGPRVLPGDSLTGLTIHVNWPGPDVTVAATCTVNNLQGTPDSFYGSHNSDFSQNPINQAIDPSSPLVSPSGGQNCVLATNTTYTDILATSGGINGPPIGEGARSLACMFDPATGQYHHQALPGRDTSVTCPGHSAGSGGIAACYKELDATHTLITPVSIWGDDNEWCSTNDPVTESCIGIIGNMSTGTGSTNGFNYNLPDWHDYRLCHGEAACHSKISKYAGGQSRGADDGSDMGVKSFSAIDAAQTANQYCVPNCSNGSFPDH